MLDGNGLQIKPALHRMAKGVDAPGVGAVEPARVGLGPHALRPERDPRACRSGHQPEVAATPLRSNDHDDADGRGQRAGRVHVVFGAGQVGRGLAEHLAARGHRVRIARRSATPVAGLEVAQVDARDVAAVREVTRDAAVVYHCMNPSAYTAAAWQAEFPAFGEALIAGAQSAGARLVCLDNLYPYGPGAASRTEDSPHAAPGPKGQVRVAWERRLRAAGASGLRWTLGRAGDFVGPGTGEQSLLSPSVVRRATRGASVWLPGDPDAVHAFTAVPDAVAGLGALGDAAGDVEGRVWHLPILEVTPRALVGAIGAAAGAAPRVRRIPGWALRGLGPVVPLLRELRETLYQWEAPFRASDAAFRARFPGVAPASLDRLARATVATVAPAVLLPAT